MSIPETERNIVLKIMQDLDAKYDERLALVDAYWSKGEPQKAARCLREAAEFADKYAEAKNWLFSETPVSQ